MLLWMMGVGFENTCKVQGSEMSPGLLQNFMDEYKKFFIDFLHYYYTAVSQ